MTADNILGKYEKLKSQLRSYEKVAIAFSGGIDSSFLLFTAGESLGKENVIALHGRSCLNSSQLVVESLFDQFYSKCAHLKVIDLDPLTWPDFITNTEKRCYFCKKKTYTSFLNFLKNEGNYVLMDGTNTDDLQEDRPGLAVLKELSVKTPLVDAGIGKRILRFLAAYWSLPNYWAPSNSCLATRLNSLSLIEEKDLKLVEIIESLLTKWGFNGCRVRPRKSDVTIEIRQQDFNTFVQKYNRIRLQNICYEFGFERVLLDIKGR